MYMYKVYYSVPYFTIVHSLTERLHYLVAKAYNTLILLSLFSRSVRAMITWDQHCCRFTIYGP